MFRYFIAKVETFAHCGYSAYMRVSNTYNLYLYSYIVIPMRLVQLNRTSGGDVMGCLFILVS